MRRIARVTLVALGISTVGCGVTRHVDRPTTPAELLQYGAPTTIVYEPVDVLDADRPRAGLDYVVATTETEDGHLDAVWTASDILVPFAQVRAVEVKSRWRSGIMGLAIGAAAGLALGWLAGTQETDDPPCVPREIFDCIFYEQQTGAHKAWRDRIVGTSTGALVGVTVGVLAGAVDRYEF
jgi:hypothetical protein